MTTIIKAENVKPRQEATTHLVLNTVKTRINNRLDAYRNGVLSLEGEYARGRYEAFTDALEFIKEVEGCL